MRGSCEAPSLVELREGTSVKMCATQSDTEDEDSSCIVQDAVEKSAWGIASSVDIYDCDPAAIRSADKIRRFVVRLCDLIGMKRFRDMLVVDFGEDERVAGFSMVQLIETSLISAHFANKTNTAYIDVFSCKPYDPRIVKEFALKFFGGSRCLMNVNLRL